MPFELTCPSCRRQLRVPDTLIGQRVKCPTCMVTFTAEEPTGSAPPPPPPPPAESVAPPRQLEPREQPSRWDDRYDRRRDDDERDEPPYRRGGPDIDRGPEFRADALPHRAGLVLTLGIVSVALSLNCCWLAPLWGLGFGIPAWVMGQSDLRKIRSGAMDPDGESNTKAGWVCGIIGTCMGGLSLVAGVGFILLMVLTAK